MSRLAPRLLSRVGRDALTSSDFRRRPGAFASRRSPVSLVRTDAAAASADGAGDVNIFPRLRVRDPYRRLGISEDASYEEVQEARNYLVTEHATHIAGVEAIEGAFDRIVAQKLRERKKKNKLSVSLRRKKEPVPDSWSEKFRSATIKPPLKTILQQFFVFALLAAWSLKQAATTGPAFQVAVGFGLCMYYLKTRGQSLKQMFKNTIIGFFVGWVVGTVVPVYVPVFPPWIGPETVCAIFAFVALWVVATWIK